MEQTTPLIAYIFQPVFFFLIFFVAFRASSQGAKSQITKGLNLGNSFMPPLNGELNWVKIRELRVSTVKFKGLTKVAEQSDQLFFKLPFQKAFSIPLSNILELQKHSRGQYLSIHLKLSSGKILKLLMTQEDWQQFPILSQKEGKVASNQNAPDLSMQFESEAKKTGAEISETLNKVQRKLLIGIAAPIIIMAIISLVLSRV